MTSFNLNHRQTNERNKFADAGEDRSSVITQSTSANKKVQVTGESISFSSGSAGTTGVVSVEKAPILNSDYSVIGALNDSSFSFGTGTVLTTEVAWNYDVDDSTQLASLSNGEFAVDYVTGKIRYAKATTGTSDTVSYYVKQLLNDDTYNSSNNSQNVTVSNPEYSQADLVLNVSVTNETNATINRYFSMDKYNRYSIHYVVGTATDTITMTVEASNDDDSIADSSKTYTDITQYGHDISTAGSTSATYTASAILSLIPGTKCKTVKIKTVSSGGANDGDYDLKVYAWNE